jgi:hypothetical protein
MSCTICNHLCTPGSEVIYLFIYLFRWLLYRALASAGLLSAPVADAVRLTVIKHSNRNHIIECCNCSESVARPRESLEEVLIMTIVMTSAPVDVRCAPQDVEAYHHQLLHQQNNQGIKHVAASRVSSGRVPSGRLPGGRVASGRITSGRHPLPPPPHLPYLDPTMLRPQHLNAPPLQPDGAAQWWGGQGCKPQIGKPVNPAGLARRLRSNLEQVRQIIK